MYGTVREAVALLRSANSSLSWSARVEASVVVSRCMKSRKASGLPSGSHISVSSPNMRNRIRAIVTEISWSRIGRSVLSGVGAFEGGVHACHQLGGAAGLVLGFDVEGVADAGEEGVGVEFLVEGGGGLR